MWGAVGRCDVCGGRHFGQLSYRYAQGLPTAPALECRSCGAIKLDEQFASSQEETTSVRLAMAARSALSSRVEQTTWRDESPTSPR